MSGRDVLSDDRKKAPADSQGRRSRERPWLQLMCCAPVSGHEVGCVFWSNGSCQDRGPKWVTEESERMRCD